QRLGAGFGDLLTGLFGHGWKSFRNALRSHLTLKAGAKRWQTRKLLKSNWTRLDCDSDPPIGSVDPKRSFREIARDDWSCPQRAEITSGLSGEPGEAQDQSYDGVRRTGHDLSEQVDVNAQLRLEHRQEEENADHDHHAVRLQRSKRFRERPRQHADGDPATVQRRKRDHVEHGENDVDDDGVAEVGQAPLADGGGKQANSMD